jgi:hypothetical protein
MPTLTSTLLIATGGGYQSGQQSGQPIVLHNTPFLLERIEPSPNNSVQTIRFKQFSTKKGIAGSAVEAALVLHQRLANAVKMCGQDVR